MFWEDRKFPAQWKEIPFLLTTNHSLITISTELFLTQCTLLVSNIERSRKLTIIVTHLSLQNTVIALCTTRLQFKIIHSIHAIYICVLYTPQNVKHLYLNSSSWLDFVTDIQCVYCAVRNLYLRILQLDFLYWALKIENLDKSQNKSSFNKQNK